MPQHSQVPTQIYNRFLQGLLKEIFFFSLNIPNQLGTQISLRETKCTTNCLSQREKGKRGEKHCNSKQFSLVWVPPHCQYFGNTLKEQTLSLPSPIRRGHFKEQQIFKGKYNEASYILRSPQTEYTIPLCMEAQEQSLARDFQLRTSHQKPDMKERLNNNCNHKGQWLHRHPKREGCSHTWEPDFKTAAPEAIPKSLLQLPSRDFTMNDITEM